MRRPLFYSIFIYLLLNPSFVFSEQPLGPKNAPEQVLPEAQGSRKPLPGEDLFIDEEDPARKDSELPDAKHCFGTAMNYTCNLPSAKEGVKVRTTHKMISSDIGTHKTVEEDTYQENDKDGKLQFRSETTTTRILDQKGIVIDPLTGKDLPPEVQLVKDITKMVYREGNKSGELPIIYREERTTIRSLHGIWKRDKPLKQLRNGIKIYPQIYSMVNTQYAHDEGNFGEVTTFMTNEGQFTLESRNGDSVPSKTDPTKW